MHLLNNDRIKAQRLLLIGVGERDEYTRTQVSQMAGTAVRLLRGKSVKSLAIVPRLEGSPNEIASAVVEGSVMAVFDPDKYRTSDKENRTIERLVVASEGADQAGLNTGIERGRVIGEAVNLARDMANEPGAYLTPTIMAERAREVANEFNLSIDVLDEERMQQEGMGSLLSVARGSDEPAKLIILKYTPESPIKSDGLLAFVGKGVTFDSGGISLKPGETLRCRLLLN
jgi:leucyl aminopeptidase